MKTIIIGILSFLFLIIMSTNSFANSAHGILMVVKGDVQIIQKDKSIKAKVGTKVIPGDTITTGKDSRAKLVMVDKNIINISPDSKFVMEKYDYNPEQNKKGALLNVIYGKVRTTVNQKYDGDKNKFQVKTKSSVAGVRGTDFLVSFNQVTNTSKVVTFEGVVEVGQGLDSFGKITNPVSVTPGQFTVAALGTPPAAPVTMPETEIASLNEQSVADAPKENNETPVPGDKKERAPSNQQPSGNTQPSSPGSVLNEMGEDVAAPVTSDTTTMLPPPPPPPIGSTIGTTSPCPNGQCLPTQDPSTLQGKTNLQINLQPNN